MTTAKRKSPPEPRDGTGGHNTCDASSIPENPIQGKRSQPTEKAVPPRRSRTAPPPAGPSGARSLAAWDSLKGNGTLVPVKDRKALEHTPTADAGDIALSGDAVTVAMPQTVAQTTSYPLTRASVGGCAIKTISAPPPHPHTVTKWGFTTSNRPQIWRGQKMACQGVKK